MYSRPWACSLVVALTAMTVIGCYSTYPSSVYGPGGYPGTAAPPAGGYPQGGSYVLPGAQPLPPAGSGSSNRWQAPSGGNAPLYEPTPEIAPPGGNENPVPEYNDVPGAGGENPPEFNDGGGFGDTQEFGSPSAPDPGGENSSPFGEAAVDSPDDDSFAAPDVSLSPVSRVRTVVDAAFAPKSGPSPYKYDRENFRWLRGVVDYDRDARTWNIIYDLEPDADDEYGGSIVLLDGEEGLRTLEEDDVVLVEGRVDAAQLDSFGKPMFHVERIVRLEAAE